MEEAPQIRLVPRYASMEHIEPFMLPATTRMIIDLTNSPQPPIPMRSRLTDVIDLTDSPKPPHFITTRMEFQSPVTQEIIHIDQAREQQEEEIKKSPHSVIEELMLNLKSCGDEVVDEILLNGTP